MTTLTISPLRLVEVNHPLSLHNCFLSVQHEGYVNKTWFVMTPGFAVGGVWGCVSHLGTLVVSVCIEASGLQKQHGLCSSRFAALIVSCL